MARTRYIKPDFFDDTDIAELSIEARLLYIGLWTLMDRNGICEFEPKLIKKSIFGYDDKITVTKVENLLSDLIEKKFIRLVDFEDRKYLFCPTFERHQWFHKEEKPKYLIPHDILFAAPLALHENSSTTTQEQFNASASQSVTVTKNGNGNEEPETNADRIVPRMLFDLWNEKSGNLPKAKEFSLARKKYAECRIREKPSRRYWEQVIERMAASKFCNGGGPTGWVADFDFLLKADSHIRVLEGKYEDRSVTSPSKKIENSANAWVREQVEEKKKEREARGA